jgi:hypothetical protein
MRTIKVYDTYSFKTKDPIIDEMRSAWQASNKKISTLASTSGVSYGTIQAWFGGKTRSPQTASASAFMGALGYERRWIRTHRALKRAEVAAAKKKSNGKG